MLFSLSGGFGFGHGVFWWWVGCRKKARSLGFGGVNLHRVRFICVLLGFSGWAWPVFESNVIFGFFRPIWVMGFGLFRRASSQMVFLIDFLSILGLDLGLGRRLLCEHDVVSLLRLIL